MPARATVDAEGRVTLPAELREQLGVGPGDEVELRVGDGGALEVRAGRGSILDLAGSVRVRKRLTLAEMDEAIVRGATGR